MTTIARDRLRVHLSGLRAEEMSSWFLSGAISLLGLLLGFTLLSAKSIWIDEAFSISIARMDWQTTWHLISRYEANMAVYYAILHVWIQLGDSEFMLRSLSVIFGVAAIPVFYHVGLHLFDKRTAALASFLMVINGFWLQYSQDARGYSLSLLLVCLATLVFLKGLQTRRWIFWVAYVLFSTVAIYTHMLNGLLLCAHLSSLVFMQRREVPIKQVAASAIAIGLLAAPLATYALAYSDQAAVTVPLTPIRFLMVFYELSGGHAAVLNAVRGMTPLPLYVFTAAGCLSMAVLRREWLANRLSPQAWRMVFLLAWTGVPIFLACVASLYQSVMEPRYFMVSFPGLILWIAAGITQQENRRMAALAMVAVVGVSLLAGSSYLFLHQKEGWRDASNYAMDGGQDGDAALFFIPSGSLSFEYYSERSPEKARLVEERFAYVPGSKDFTTNPLFYGFDVPPPVQPDFAERMGANYERVWLFISHAEDTGEVHGLPHRLAEVQAALSQYFEVVEQRDFEQVSVLKYERRTLSDPASQSRAHETEPASKLGPG